MPRISLSPELKDAIKGLSIRDKDKLLLRLIPKDDKLVERLEFELIEESQTTEHRRQVVSVRIHNSLNEVRSGIFFSPGFLLSTLRHSSGKISRHLFVTKDKYGEIALNLQMLIKALEDFGRYMPDHFSRKARNLNTYIAKRGIKILNLIAKLHEDYQLDFEEDLQKLGKLILKQGELSRVAWENGLDAQALAEGDF